MKKFFAALVVAVSVTGGVWACGGMTAINPPSLQLDKGPAEVEVDSVVDDLEGIVVLC